MAASSRLCLDEKGAQVRKTTAGREQSSGNESARDGDDGDGEWSAARTLRRRITSHRIASHSDDTECDRDRRSTL